MIIFKWEPIVGEKSRKSYIKWECSFDGKYEDWQMLAGSHPFARTFIYQEGLHLPSEVREIQKDENGVETIGDFVADNEVTRALCSMIDDMLAKKNVNTGNTNDYCYFQRLLSNLCDLWD